MKIYITKIERENLFDEYFEVHVEDSEKVYFSKSFDTKEKAEIFANGVLAGASIFVGVENPIKIIRKNFTSTDK